MKTKFNVERSTYDLADLIERRKACRICVDRDPDRIVSAASFSFDPEVVSHWAQWLGHLNPRLVIVGQDFSDAGYFEWHHGADDPRSATNANLHRLLTIAGFSPGRPPLPDPDTPIYLTNSILCLKHPPMNRPIADRWVRACSSAQLTPLISRLDPEAVVGMGSHGWRAVRLALGLEDASSSIQRAAGGCWTAASRIAFAVGHCGPLGLANRSWSRQTEDWSRIGAALNLGSGREK
ncbi:uracil-DNA glycosylase family protein [Methylobacterium persicinum]|uniref:Uracil-DNA glycosylase n=1 Tax=Methylobacterium persicinum TaxID=374426 RepID=A0ABU0HUT0_9HYPH|nr:uracil-DNA glycosylase family protein [Methylobacterium persicinum]MDQ0445259.1 uracil-DNA glycosylase [Methylobacterium persicinum]GJE37880.1 hypothetical protein KHHGKMAE_1944 [Methylobacterium persicinum]